jgi:Cu/Ag efflux protein CusF
VAAEVMKVDKAAGRITLKHGEIKSLDMPAITMAWRVSEARLLDDIAVGDRVRFVPERINGQYTITTLIKAPQ